jgi:Queuosine biosynthesis protein QueC
MRRAHPTVTPSSTIAIQVAEREVRTPRGVQRCQIGTDVQFLTERLESYFFAQWEPVAYDALLLAAAVEFADVTHVRPTQMWRRDFELRIPVHEPERWNSTGVTDALHDTLAFLTGDRWALRFYARVQPARTPRQRLFPLPSNVDTVIPFSNGLDSRCVAGLLARKMGSALVRIRLGSAASDNEASAWSRQAFTAVPYYVRPQNDRRRESTGRSRGFKFAVISAIAAFLAKAERIIIPESGQGAIGPALVTVGQAYEDYRSHPLFTRRMEEFVQAIFNHRVRFTFPQIWQTKGETLRQFVEETGDHAWSSTRSCWQQNRHVSVDGKARQCGICAACMLRRMSVHAAGLVEAANCFVWEDLSASRFEDGAAPSFPRPKITPTLREYAIAGVLHLDHLAGLLRSKANAPALRLASFQLGQALGLSQADGAARLDRLLLQHAQEWHAFVRSLGPSSFVASWAGSVRA